jgi:hypothetical protein
MLTDCKITLIEYVHTERSCLTCLGPRTVVFLAVNETPTGQCSVFNGVEGRSIKGGEAKQ